MILKWVLINQEQFEEKEVTTWAIMAQEGYIGALCRLGQVVHKLKDCSAELNEVERIIVTELNTDDMEATEEERPDLFLLAGTLREIVNSLKTGLEGVSDMRIVNSTKEYPASGEDNTRSRWNRPSPVLEPAESSKVKRRHHPFLSF